MKGGAEMVVPPLFRCPISLDLFKDPVTLCTGQTYDRYWIEKWLAAGNLTCPVTMQKLDDVSIVPNHTLSHLIDIWLQSSSQIEQNCLEIDDCDVSFAAMKQIIESDESALDCKSQVLEKIHALSQELPFNNSCLIRLDFFGLLLELVLRNAGNLHIQESSIFLEKALVCVLKLMPFSDKGAFNILKKEHKFEGFLFLFEKGSILIKRSLCLLVEAISSSVETQKLCEMLGKSVEILKQIVHLVQNKSEAIEAGIRAVSALSLIESNRENLVKEGGVEGLIEYVSKFQKQERNSIPIAMSAIENLLSVEIAKDVIINHPFGVNSLVKMVFRVSNHEGSESAVNSLLIICCDSQSGRERAIFHGVLTQLLLLLQSQCSGRTKTKARMLLKLLRSMWNEDSNNASSL